MAVAKMSPYTFKGIKKKIKKVAKKGKELLPRIFPPLSKAPGQVDYPAIPRVLEAEKRRRKLLDEIGK